VLLAFRPAFAMSSLPLLPPAENITCLTRLDHNRALGQASTGSMAQGTARGWGGVPLGCGPDTCCRLSALHGGQRLAGWLAGAPAASRLSQSALHQFVFVHTITRRLSLPHHHKLSLTSPHTHTRLPRVQLSERSGVHVSKVKNVIIWGNHSSTQYPDVNHATIDGKPARQVLRRVARGKKREFFLHSVQALVFCKRRGCPVPLADCPPCCSSVGCSSIGSRPGLPFLNYTVLSFCAVLPPSRSCFDPLLLR
jgi:hypothetical protein